MLHGQFAFVPVVGWLRVAFPLVVLVLPRDSCLILGFSQAQQPMGGPKQTMVNSNHLS